jgi:hypothetical protein
MEFSSGYRNHYFDSIYHFNHSKKKEGKIMSIKDFFLDKKSTDVDKTELSENILKDWFSKCADVSFQRILIGKHECMIFYCEGLCNSEKINEVILPMLEKIGMNDEWIDTETLAKEKIYYCDRSNGMQIQQEVITKIFSGQLFIFLPKFGHLFAIDIAKPPQRVPEEPNLEMSIQGPKDGLIEDLSTNVAIIRKRLRTASLYYEQFTVGERTQTRIALLYIHDIAKPTVIEHIRNQLLSIKVDGIIGSNQMEELLLQHSPFTIFPVCAYSGRPDFIADSLLHGRFVLILDGIPTAIIAPATLSLLIKTPEDAHFPYFFVSAERLLRIFGLFISLLLPGFWIALISYHPDQLPFTLLATLAVSRQGVPVPAPLECFIMMFLFELFREAGLRLPAAIGQTLSVVGGLIIGQAAISAGLTSPGILVATAISIVSTFTLVNQALIGTVSLLRIIVVFASSILGIVGFFISAFCILIYLANLESFGVSYLSTISTLNPKEMISGLIQVPKSIDKGRSPTITSKDQTRQGGNQS